MTHMIQDILKLSVSERILMVEAIWDSITEEVEELELSPEVKRLLDERLEAHKNNPNEGYDWDEVKAKIKKQF